MRRSNFAGEEGLRNMSVRALRLCPGLQMIWGEALSFVSDIMMSSVRLLLKGYWPSKNVHFVFCESTLVASFHFVLGWSLKLFTIVNV